MAFVLVPTPSVPAAAQTTPVGPRPGPLPTLAPPYRVHASLSYPPPSGSGFLMAAFSPFIPRFTTPPPLAPSVPDQPRSTLQSGAVPVPMHTTA